MRKRVLGIALLLAAAAAGGAWWLVRRQPGMPGETAPSAAFSIQQTGSGWLIQHLDEQIPLRAFRWLPAQGEALLVAQMLTQNDEQQVHLFRAGRHEGSWKIERPQTVSEAFFRFAELKDAVMLPGSSMLLMYAAGSGQEPSLLVCLDLSGGSVRWSLRLQGSRIALAEDPKDPAVFVWGSDRAVERIPLAAGKVPSPALIELTAETPAPADLLPTGATSFFLAHAKGVSRFSGSKGWVHHPMPEPPPFPYFPERLGRLARRGPTIWWQPFPGALYKLDSERLLAREVPLDLDAAAAQDSRLLHLLGIDPKGDLWFGLAEPLTAIQVKPAPAVTPAPAGEGRGDASTVLPAEPPRDLPAPPAQSPEEIGAWQQHLARGLGRFFRRSSNGGPLRRYHWNALWKTLPGSPGMSASPGDARLRPESGFVVLGAERRTWWLPLAALGDGEPVPTPPPAAPEGTGPAAPPRPGNRTGSAD